MKTFKLSVDFCYNVNRSNYKHFDGKFVLEDDQKTIKGIINYIDNSSHYLYGIYNESQKKLIFLDMSCRSDPFIFCFSGNIGVCSTYSFNDGCFFSRHSYDGNAMIVDFSEIDDPYSILSEKLLTNFRRLSGEDGLTNLLIMQQGVERYQNLYF